jgi:UPF0271 protein
MRRYTLDSHKKKVVILDTSAFITGFDPLSVDYEQYSVPLVEKELIINSLSWTRFKTTVDSGRIKLKKPSFHFLKRVRDVSKQLGDVQVLSEVDLKILALALELKSKGNEPSIITDDYSIQNVANYFCIDFIPITNVGIRFRLHWILYCPGCHRKYSYDYKRGLCEICGTKLKRKPFRKKFLK